MIKLYNLIPDKIIKQQNISNISLCGISCDSRKIKKNYIFAALVGVSENGLDYINEAINNGAIVIITDNNSFLAASKPSKSFGSTESHEIKTADITTKIPNFFIYFFLKIYITR